MIKPIYTPAVSYFDENSYCPYTYLIGWPHLDKWYYGVSYSKGKKANPTKLWVSYFTSSIHVENFRKEHGEPTIIQIRKIFTTGEDARSWEHRVLKHVKVTSSDKWLNKHDGTSPDKESALRGARAKKPWKQEDSRREILRKTARKTIKAHPYITELLHSKQSQLKSQTIKRVNRSLGMYKESDKRQSRKRKEWWASNSNKGRCSETWFTSEFGKKMATKNNYDITCPHCGKTAQKAAMKRWHFDNCPQRIT